MKTTSHTEIVQPKLWWIRDTETKEHRYPSPACTYAEHRFLSFLILLNKISKKNKKLEQKVVRPLLIYSYNSDKTLDATGILKTSLSERLSLGKSTKYSFYESTYLVLTGELAGTVANPAEFHIYRKRKNPGIPVTSYRPLQDHGEILDLISTEIELLRARAHIKQETERTHQIQLLQETETVIQKMGYIPALLHVLGELKLPHNAEAIQYNSSIYNAK